MKFSLQTWWFNSSHWRYTQEGLYKSATKTTQVYQAIKRLVTNSLNAKWGIRDVLKVGKIHETKDFGQTR